MPIAATATPSVALPGRNLHSSGTASDSICPKGWRLPGYSGSGSWYDLVRKYNNGTGNSAPKDTFLQISPLSFFRSGRYYYVSGALYYRTSIGDYWSGRFYSRTNSYNLDFGSTYLYPQHEFDRGYGFSLRCLVR